MDHSEAVGRFFGGGSSLSVSCDDEPQALVVRLSGPLDLKSSQQLQEFLLWAIGHVPGRSGLALDLSGVEYISSTGVGALSVALMAAKKRDIDFRLRGMQDKVRAVFKLLGLLEYFKEDTDYA
jgi:anti-anti-sigma factor